MTSQIWWYTARSGGFLAWGLLAASVIWGLALTTKVAGRLHKPAWLLDLHRFLGGAALVFTGIHIVAILIDSYVHFSIANVLVPFTGTWHPVAVAWGIISLYLLAAVEVTSLLRASLPQTLWRQVHWVSFPLFALTTLHTLTAGADRHSPVVIGATVVVCGAIVALTGLRVASLGRPIDRRPSQSLRPL